MPAKISEVKRKKLENELSAESQEIFLEEFQQGMLEKFLGKSQLKCLKASQELLEEYQEKSLIESPKIYGNRWKLLVEILGKYLEGFFK